MRQSEANRRLEQRAAQQRADRERLFGIGYSASVRRTATGTSSVAHQAEGGTLSEQQTVRPSSSATATAVTPALRSLSG